MDDFIDFLKEFAKVEYDAHIALFCERDKAKYLEAIKPYRAFLSGKMITHVGMARGEHKNDNYFDKADASRKALVPRRTFVVARYEHEDLKEVYVAVQGMKTNTIGMDTTFEKKRIFIKKGDSFQMVADGQMCMSCRGISGSDCADCNGSGWEFVATPELGVGLGKIIEVVKLEEPHASFSKQYAEF